MTEKKATENGITVKVKSRSATAMLAINMFVIFVDEVFFKTAYKPNELPNKAMKKITAYADVMPILTSDDIPLACCSAVAAAAR